MGSDLAAAYRDLRLRILDMTASLSAEEERGTVPCCPAWSVRDLLCHLAGVPADILTGNTADAATEAWADSQVTRRKAWHLERIRAELDEAGRQVDELLVAFPDRFPPQFYLDAWTHEADLAHALGCPAAADLRLVDHVLDFLVDFVDRSFSKAGLGPVAIDGLGSRRVVGQTDGQPAELHTSRFELARATMGRRSLAQLAALDWRGIDGADAGPLLVAWSPNDVDIVEAEPVPE